MRQRASTKTQRRLKQQQLSDPYALTDDVYSETRKLRIDGLVTTDGVLKLGAVLAVSCFCFGNMLLVCGVLLVVVGLAMLHQRDTKAPIHGVGLKQAINRLLALRRNALDYTLTLSIAQSDEYTKPPLKKELQIDVLSTSSTPQQIVATMALKEEEALTTRQSRKTKHLADIVPVMTLHRVSMKPLSIISSFAIETMDELEMEKPRAHSEPKQVLRSRPLLPLKAKVPSARLTQEKTTQGRPTSAVVKTSTKQEKKITPVQDKTTHFQQKKTTLEPPMVSTTKHIQLPAVLPGIESSPVAIPAVLPASTTVVELPPKSKVREVVSPTITAIVEPVACAVAPLPVPKHKPLVEVAYGKAAIERDLVVTRKVLLYLNGNVESLVNLEEQDLEQESECEQDVVKLQHEPAAFALSLEAFPLLSPPVAPQESMSVPTSDAEEPNFLLDIELEPISKPEKHLNAIRSHLEPVGSVDLWSMIDELDAMRSELDAAMACCTSLLQEGEKVSKLDLPKLKLKEKSRWCCY